MHAAIEVRKGSQFEETILQLRIPRLTIMKWFNTDIIG